MPDRPDAGAGAAASPGERGSRAPAARPPPGARGDGYRWRQAATLLCFAAFGLSGLWFGFVRVPLLRLLHRDRARRGSATRRALRGTMRGLMGLFRALRVLDWEVVGPSPPAGSGTMVVCNHPSLIDAVMMLAVLPDAHCIVKDALTRNPFVSRAIDGLGYPDNARPEALVERCVAVLAAGHPMLVFPEGTRTPPGRAILPLQRGAAYVAVRAACPVVLATIRVSEPTLYKGARWWEVPARRPRFVVRFHPPIPPQARPDDADGAAARVANRRWEAFFREELGRAESA
jgi:1-acyl-sn-glycerol-3-phosphate acyltransferase